MASSLAFCLIGLGVGGCIVSDPAGYAEPTQTTPVLDAHTADPQPTSIVRVSSGDALPISVQFRSEDIGEEVVAVLFLNYANGGQGTYQAGIPIAASTWDDVREVSMIWNVPPLPGCNQLTLVVTHESNIQQFTNRIVEADRAATLTWWVNIDDSNDTLNDCPDPTQSDAGGAP